MNDVNLVIISGRLGRDPEQRHTSAGKSVVNFSVACGRKWRDKDTGEQKENLEWFNVVSFNDGMNQNFLMKFVQKGSRVHVVGALQTREYTDKDNINRKVTEIVISAYRGEVTLLGQPQSARDEGEYGRTRSRGQGGTQGIQDQYERQSRGEGGTGSRGGGGFGRSTDYRRDMDDDIPF